MDKIIDGVDVSGCEHYRAEIETKMPYGEYEILKDKCHYSGIEIIQDCKGNKDCIYKQLKRLQAEYDDLHLTYAGCKTANTGLQELNQKLQAESKELERKYADVLKLAKENADSNEYCLQELEKENAELKEECERLKKQYNCYACDSCGGKEDYINMKQHTENAIKTVHKYGQALQEIKDIADRTDGNHPASVINMVSVIRHTINSVIGEE